MTSTERARGHQIARHFTKALHREVLGGSAEDKMAAEGFAQHPRVARHDGRTGAVTNQGADNGNSQRSGLEGHGWTAAADEVTEHAAPERGEDGGKFFFVLGSLVQTGEGAKHVELNSRDGEAVDEGDSNQRGAGDERRMAEDQATTRGGRGLGIKGRCRHAINDGVASHGGKHRVGVSGKISHEQRN